MAQSTDRNSQFEGVPRLRSLGSLALTALPALVISVIGLGYLKHEAGIAEREFEEAAASFAMVLARKLDTGLRDYRETPQVRLRTVKSWSFEEPEILEPRMEAENLAAFATYEAALGSDRAAARAMLEKGLAAFDQRFTPAGLPLRPLAEYHLARLSSEAGEKDAVIQWLGRVLETAVETYPSLISETLVERASVLAEKHDCSEKIGVEHWRERWRQSDRTRKLLRRDRVYLSNNFDAGARWFRDGGEDYFWDLRDSGESVVFSKSELEDLAGQLVGEVIQEGGRSPYPLAVRIMLEGSDIRPAPLNDPAERKAFLQRRGYNPIATNQMKRLATRAWANGYNRSYVEVSSADHEAFRSAVRRRVWTQGGFLGVVMLLLGVGIWKTWAAMETQRKLNRQQSDFISSVSHELRAPVAGIRLLSERLAVEKDENAKRDEYVHLIEREAGRLGTLVANVLDVTRIGQGRKSYHFEPADIAALVRDTVDGMRPLAEEQGLVMNVEIVSPEHDPEIDAVAIQQALGNLIDNAIKFSPEGGKIEVNLKPRNAEDQARGFLISVTDEGPGIPLDEQEKIFERFYRVGSELRRETPGAGIGLSLVRHIAEAHGGSVLVESAPGEGSRFVLRILG